MIQRVYVFLVLSTSLRVAGNRRFAGVQVGEMNDRDPNAQMTCEDHYLLGVRWMQVGRDISIAQCL